MKRLLSMLLACLLLAGLLSGLSVSGFAAETVSYLDENGNTQTANLTARVGDSTHTLSNGFWLVESSVHATALTVSGSNVNLVLADGCELSAECIHLTQGRKLTIYAQSDDASAMGRITLTDQTMGGTYAAIGAYVSNGANYAAGELVVNGGMLTVTGYGDSAIGGCQVYVSSSDSYEALGGGTITINGGVINATTSSYAAAIGGRDANITINGGTVNAFGYPGIGGPGSTVTINGGTVTSTGTDNAAGIGGGQSQSAALVTISDGTVTAVGGKYGAGIGGGEDADGTVVINGGTVTATGGQYGASIGGGYGGFGTVTINGGNVQCYGGQNGVGVGGGRNAFCDVKLLGGRVDATDLYIGSGDEYRYGGDVLLGWTNHTDCYKAMRWRGILNRVDGKYFIPKLNHNRVEDLQAFSDNNYNGILIPCVYAAVFDGGVASGQMDTLYTNPVDSPILLPNCGYTVPEGYLFQGWGIDGTLYAPGNYYRPNADVVIEAVWQQFFPVSGIQVTTTQDLSDLRVGTQFTVTANVQPSSATIPQVDWSSTDSGVVTVDAGGLVTTVGVGTAEIRATATDGSGVYGTLSLTVRETPVGSITLSAADTMAVGTSQTVEATVTPNNASNPALAWSSSDDTVATVNDSGLVTAVSVGTAQIVAAATDGSGVYGAVAITVYTVPVGSITLSAADTMFAGTSQIVVATVTPDNATNPALAWSSSDDTVANVDNSGLVTVVSAGTAEITAAATDGSGVSAALTLTVIEPVTRAVDYIDKNGDLQTAPTVLPIPGTQWSAGWYVAEGDVTLDARVQVFGDVHLILADGCTLTVDKGIGVCDTDNASLTVYAQSTGSDMGKLTAKEVALNLAAIGGKRYIGSGVITINGGALDVVGGTNAAGIGGGANAGGTVIIHGGKVTASTNISSSSSLTTGSYAAGIGGGYKGGAKVTITGGTVTATGGDYSTGIGGGYQGSASVTITGGNVTATGGQNGAGIGSGYGGAGGKVSLSWTAATDCITASSYNGTVTLQKAFTDGTDVLPAGEVTDNAVLNGKTLTPWTQHDVRFLGHSLSLKGDIGVNFYVDLNGENPEHFRAVYSWGGYTSDPVNLSTIPAIPAGQENAGCYKLTAGVAAKEMTDTVTVTIYCGNTAVAWNAYSVKQYCDTILVNKDRYGEKLWTLACAMLLYGAKAQTQFGNYNSDRLADADLADQTLSEVDTATLGACGSADLSAFGLRFTGRSLVLESKTSHKLYFDVSDQATLDATTITCGSLTLERGTDTNGFYVIIPNMAAKNVLKNYTLTFTKDGAATTKLRVNAGAYIGTVLDDTVSSASLGLDDARRNTLKDTVTALYWYSKAAEAYFG